MAEQRWARWLVVGLMVAAVGVAALSLVLRSQLRCAGFPGGGIVAADLPAGPPPDGVLRVAVFNIRNFPLDDRPPEPDLPYSRRTNVCDLLDTLAGLDADVLGVEEIRETVRFLRLLKRVPGPHRYRAVFSDAAGAHGQHLGIAWDDQRLELVGAPEEIPEVALGDPALRPALAATLRSRSDDGVDFTVVQVHLKSAPRGYEVRQRQFQVLAEWARAQAGQGEGDLIIQGDFNTTGPPGGTLEEELAEADAIFAAAGLRRLPNVTGCSEYWEGPGRWDGVIVPSLLDHVWVRDLEELDPSTPLEAWLHCARFDCRELVSRAGAEDATFWDVSDHCPLTFQVLDRDLD